MTSLNIFFYPPHLLKPLHCHIARCHFRYLSGEYHVLNSGLIDIKNHGQFMVATPGFTGELFGQSKIGQKLAAGY